MRFNTPARVDVSAVARFAPPWVKNAAWRIDGNAIIVEFETDSDSGYHDFKDGSHVVLDILAPKTDGAAYVPPGGAKPTITAMNAAKAPDTIVPANAGASAAQAKAIAQTSEKLAAQQPADKTKPVAKPADAKAGRKTGGATRNSGRRRRSGGRSQAHPRWCPDQFQGRRPTACRRVRARPHRLGGAGECAELR